jgi:hypothetical protein
MLIVNLVVATFCAAILLLVFMVWKLLSKL